MVSWRLAAGLFDKAMSSNCYGILQWRGHAGVCGEKRGSSWDQQQVVIASSSEFWGIVVSSVIPMLVTNATLTSQFNRTYLERCWRAVLAGGSSSSLSRQSTTCTKWWVFWDDISLTATGLEGLCHVQWNHDITFSWVALSQALSRCEACKIYISQSQNLCRGLQAEISSWTMCS